MSARRRHITAPAGAYEHAAQIAEDWAAALDAQKTPAAALQASACRTLASDYRRVAKIAARGGR